MSEESARKLKKHKEGVIHDSRLKAALGKFDSRWIRMCVRHNDMLAHSLEQFTPELYQTYMCEAYGKPVMYPQESLAEIAEKLTRCCRVFHDGHPEFICKQPDFCAFCMRGRAVGVSNTYRKGLYARLSVRRQVNTLHYVVKTSAGSVAELYDAYERLALWRSAVRRCAAGGEIVIDGEKREIKYFGLTTLDCFTHVSMGQIYNSRVYVPHIHMIGQIKDQNLRGSVIQYSAKEMAQRFDLTFKKAKGYRVRLQKTVTAPHDVSELTKCIAYCAVPFKVHEVRPWERALACMAIPANYRKITRKSGGDKFHEHYTTTYQTGDCTVRYVVTRGEYYGDEPKIKRELS